MRLVLIDLEDVILSLKRSSSRYIPSLIVLLPLGDNKPVSRNPLKRDRSIWLVPSVPVLDGDIAT